MRALEDRLESSKLARLLITCALVLEARFWLRRVVEESQERGSIG